MKKILSALFILMSLNSYAQKKISEFPSYTPTGTGAAVWFPTINQSGSTLTNYKVSLYDLKWWVVDTTFLATQTDLAAAAGSGGTVTSVATSAPVTGGTITTTGTIAVDTSAADAALATNYKVRTADSLSTIVAGVWNASVIAAAYGGTGNSSYTIGDILYASGATTLSKLADIALTNVLISGGVGVAPSWGKVSNSHLSNSTISGIPLGATLNALTPGNGLTPSSTYTGNVARTFSVDTAAGAIRIPTHYQMNNSDSIGTLVAGVWNATVLDTAYTNAASRVTAGTGITVTTEGKTYKVTAINAGTVTSVATGNGLTGGTITGSGTLSTDTAAGPTRTTTHYQLNNNDSVGTLTYGVWNATTIAVANGGTGVTTSTGTTNVVLSASPTLTGTPLAPTAAAGTNTTQIATTAYVCAALPVGVKFTICQVSGTITAAYGATKSGFQSNGGAIRATGGTAASAIVSFYFDDADYPTMNGITPRLYIQGVINTNNVAPTGNYTLGLYPVSNTTGSGAGVIAYTLGTVITGSDGATWTAPANNLMQNAISASFAFPGDGLYCIGLATSGTTAASAHVGITAFLQVQY